MSDDQQLQIKQSGWFPAGSEVRKALGVLSDGAFRAYCHLCLTADRRSGTISVSYGELAKMLQRSRRSVVSYMEELRRLGICAVHTAPNQHGRNGIEMNDEYWPYARKPKTMSESDAGRYVDRIREVLKARACVRCAFTGADRKLGISWANRGIPFEQVERGILLGCARKYVSSLNGADRSEIATLAYFTETIEEAGDLETPAGYWNYIRQSLERLETRWRLSEASNAVGVK